jgi:hypothetical protein
VTTVLEGLLALLIRAEDLAGRLNLRDLIEALEAGYRELAAWPQFAHPRQRVFANDRRLTLHYGGSMDAHWGTG